MGSSAADTIQVTSVKSDENELVEGDTLISGIVLPADFFKEETQFSFSGPDGDSYVKVGYSIKTQFVSEDCGPRYILSDMKVLDHDLPDDSVRVLSKTPGRAGGTHIAVYRCPHPDTLGLIFKQLLLNPTQTTQSSRVLGADLDNITTEDGTVLYAGKRRASVHLPVKLDPGTGRTMTYTFNFADDFGLDVPQRILKISYDAVATQRYRPCGVQTFVSKILPDLNATTFDSVRLALNTDEEPQNILADPIVTNLEVFRCPVTNIIQLSLRRTGTSSTSTLADPRTLNGITTDYNAEIYHAGDSVSILQLPLNLNANSTTFSIDYKNTGIADTQLTFTYTRQTRDFYKNACGDNQVVITELALQPAATNVSVPVRSIQYPPVTNVTILNAVSE